jgi:hypothetical protein
MTRKIARVRIKLLDGKWYAFANGPRRQRNLALFVAINFCKQLNEKDGRI